MTMANATSSTPHRPSPSASLRKTNKPLMEKRRRARINDSLTQLKSLVIHSSKKDSSQFNKLEKADILELTVKHLRTLQNQQQQQQQQLPQGADVNSTGKYRAGFMECANEVIRFLKQSQSFSDDIKGRVVGHLASCLQLSQQTYAQRPTAAATIVTQAPAAPRMNTTTSNPQGASTTTAQLVNGQIIQIVNAPFQNNQVPVQHSSSAPAAVLVAAQPIQTAQPTVQQQQQQQQTAPVMSSSSTSSSSSNMNTRLPIPEPTRPQEQSASSYTRYCQPLHIQIPPTISPVLPKSSERPLQPQHQQQQLLQSHHQQQLQQQQPIGVMRSEERITSSLAPISPRSNSIPTSSTPLKDLSPPKPAAYKQLDFYANDPQNEYSSRSRTYSLASSSSSSSASESEMMSPLNLSQSPPFASTYENQHRDNIPISRPISKMATMNNQTEMSYKQETVSPVENVSSSLRDSPEYSHHNFTSVIVNRKSLDIPSAKYMRMMMEEEQRHCVRPQGTPSPASSMGEERLWRPW